MIAKYKKQIIALAVCILIGLVILIGYTKIFDMNHRYIGQWQDKDENGIYVDIVADGDIYTINITAGDDEDTIFYWEMEGRKNGNTIAYENCVKYKVSYDTYGNALEEEVYTDGKGTFSVKNNKLYWIDETEGLSKNTYFVR